MKTGLPYEQVKAENGDVLNKMIFMPVVNLHKADAEAVIDSYLTHMNPKAFELVFNNDGPEVQRLIKKVRDSGAKSLSTASGPNSVADMMMTAPWNCVNRMRAGDG